MEVFRFILLRCRNAHRAEEAGGLEGGFAGFWRIVFRDVCARAALVGGELGVADQSVRPLVDDFDLEFVLASFNDLGDVHPTRIAPDDSELFAVERDLGGLDDGSEVEKDF